MDCEASDASQKLYNMMRMSDSISYDYSVAAFFAAEEHISNRKSAINWMKYVSLYVGSSNGVSTQL
jgi:hypothetical protein